MLSGSQVLDSLHSLFLQLASVGPEWWTRCAAAMAEGEKSGSAQEVVELLPIHLRVVTAHPHKLLLKHLHTEYSTVAPSTAGGDPVQGGGGRYGGTQYSGWGYGGTGGGDPVQGWHPVQRVGMVQWAARWHPVQCNGLGGCGLIFWCSLPHMYLFHVISE